MYGSTPPPRGSSQRVIVLLKIKAMLNVSLRSKRFLASSSTKLGREQKKKGITGEEEGNEGTSSPLPLPLPPFFFLLPL